MFLARKPLASQTIAVAMLAGLMSRGESLCAAESEYEAAIAALKKAGAAISYSDENAKPSGGNKTVTEIHFFWGSKDAELESLRHLRGLPHLEDVGLVCADFDPACSKKLLQHVDVLSNLKSVLIRVEMDSPVSDAEICDFSKIPTLIQLSVGSVQTAVDVTDKGLACLKQRRGLRALILNNTRITDAGLANLSDMKHLEHLMLAGTEITGEGFRRLKGVPLRRLFLVGTKVNDENLKWLADFEQLELLFLGGCPIDGSGLKYLSGMKELRRLSLSATKIGDQALLQLQRLPKLEELYLYDCAITDEGVPALAKLEGLKRLIISKTAKLSEAGRQTLSEALPELQIE